MARRAKRDLRQRSAGQRGALGLRRSDGPDNPLGTGAMHLCSTPYRIHRSNEPFTIGTNVSSGCIRMRKQDVIVGAKDVVL
jgi:lipoprotein-anchoring transpeptidase ErfK/SrfK